MARRDADQRAVCYNCGATDHTGNVRISPLHSWLVLAPLTWIS
jgi:hypothetical protein